MLLDGERNAPDQEPKNFGVAFAPAKGMTKFFGRAGSVCMIEIP
jgi:hypothetical protein